MTSCLDFYGSLKWTCSARFSARHLLCWGILDPSSPLAPPPSTMVGTVPKIHPRGKRNLTFGGSPTKSSIDSLSFLHFACSKQQQNSAFPRAHLLGSGSYGLSSSGIVLDSISSLNWRWIYIHLWARNQQILLPGNERTHTIRFLSLFIKG